MTKTVAAGREASRFSRMFGRMLVECPVQIAAYGACIQKNASTLEKDICANEFRAMKQCSQRILANIRANR